MVLEPEFRIRHPGLLRVFERTREISPILNNDRYTVPEYQELLKFITSGELWDLMLGEMPPSYFEVQVPREYT